MKGFQLFLTRKKLFAIFLILISLGMIGWFVFFEYKVRWLEKQVEKISTHLTTQGFTISYSKVAIGGNPLFFNITLYKPSFKDPKGYLEWEGSEIIISLQPWYPYLLTCTFPGSQTLFVHKATSLPFNKLNLEGATGTFKLNSNGHLKDIDFTIKDVKFFVDSQAQPVFLQDISLRATKLIDPLNLHFSFSTRLLHLETLFDMQPFDHFCALNLDAHLAGYQAYSSFPRSLAEWRDRGGIMEVTLLRFAWPPIIGEAKGTLTLDKNMYPLGSFSSKISGYQDALADMVKLGWIKKKKAANASFVLDLLSVPDEEGGRQLTVPLTLQNGILSVGPAPLLKLCPLQNF